MVICLEAVRGMTNLSKPKVTISAWGSVHQAYHVALACQEHGLLNKFFTTFYYKENSFPYPILRSLDKLGFSKIKVLIKNRSLDGLNEQYITNYLGIELLTKALALWKEKNLTHYSLVIPLYDKIVSKSLTPCDIFYGYEDGALYSSKRAKELGAIAIVEERSLQPWYNGIIREELERLGLPVPPRGKRLDIVMERKFTEMRMADYLVVYTNRFKNYLIEKHEIPERKIIVLPLGADSQLFHPRKNGKKKKLGDKFRILFVGGISPRKGVHYLLEAVRQLNIDIELQLIGTISPGTEPILDRYSGYFNYIGPVPHRMLAYYYNNADVFVLPSLMDSFALVIYESMACGLPVIMTENCGAEIRDGVDGFRIPIRDVQALKDKILLLYEDKGLREQMSINARQWAEQHSWEKYRERIASTLLHIYQKGRG